MKLFVADAFTDRRFCGNQAGVALLKRGQEFPSDAFMACLAGELKHSETVFVKPLEDGGFRFRYFTPKGEVDLCGHATVAAFTVLREEGLGPGYHRLSTLAGELQVELSAEAVWMDMAKPERVRGFSREEAAGLYRAYGLNPDDMPAGLEPEVVSTGLRDILLPVAGAEMLERAVQNETEVIRLSKRYDVVGVHMFWPELSTGTTARCRNFAPRYAIPEEAATGTSNGGLTWYLYQRGLVAPGKENRFIQGESLGKPSLILSRLTDDGAGVRIGGQAVIALRIELCGPGEQDGRRVS